MRALLSGYWWLLLLRGVLAIVFGILAWRSPAGCGVSPGPCRNGRDLPGSLTGCLGQAASLRAGWPVRLAFVLNGVTDSEKQS
jgi:hypothetical protein